MSNLLQKITLAVVLSLLMTTFTAAGDVHLQEEPTQLVLSMETEETTETLSNIAYIELVEETFKAADAAIDEAAAIEEEEEIILPDYSVIPLDPELVQVLIDSCNENGIALEVALGLIECESNFNTNARSSAGCYGLCQLNGRYFPKNLSSADNIRYGINYLGSQLKKYGNIYSALTAYNAGYDTGGRKYANKVMSNADSWRSVLIGANIIGG